MTLTIETNSDKYQRDYITTTIKLECTAPGGSDKAIELAETILADVKQRRAKLVNSDKDRHATEDTEQIDLLVLAEVARNPGCTFRGIADSLRMSNAAVVDRALLRLSKADKVHGELAPSLYTVWYKGPKHQPSAYNGSMSDMMYRMVEHERDVYAWFAPHTRSIFAASAPVTPKVSVEDRVLMELKLAGKGEGRGRTFLEHKLCLPIDVIGAACEALESAGKITSHHAASNVLLYVAK